MFVHIGAVVCVLAATAGWAQTFDVASVRHSKPDEKPRSNYPLDNGFVFSAAGKDDAIVPTGGLFSANNLSLLTYLNFAYKLTGTQFLSLRFKEYLGSTTELPKWATDEQFDIQARAEGNPTKDQMRAMVRALLEERFKLKVHRETREVNVLALVPTQAGELGPKLRLHAADDECSGPLAPYPPVCGVIAHLAPSVPGRSSFGARDVSMDSLASSLPTQTGVGALRKPVLDKTGLRGRYDFTFEWGAGWSRCGCCGADV